MYVSNINNGQDQAKSPIPSTYTQINALHTDDLVEECSGSLHAYGSLMFIHTSTHTFIYIYIAYIYIHIHLSICLHTCVNIRVYIYLFIYIPSIFYGLNSWRFTRTMARPKLETWAASILLHLSAFRAHPMVEVGICMWD